MHQLAATLDQLDRFSQGQAARSHQGTVLAQAVTRDEGRACAAFCQPQAPQGDRGGEDGRLGFIGLVEQRFRPLLGQCPQVITQGVGSFLEGVQDQRVLRAQLGQHAEGLRTLPWKDECEGCRHVTSP